MISICLCSLMFNNPGVAFFEIIEFSKKNATLNGYELYKKMLNNSLVTYRGKKYLYTRRYVFFLMILKIVYALPLDVI